MKGRAGYCKSDDGFHIASVCIHKGEEPVISGVNGICNIFFAHCNLQCIFCQNHQISSNLAAAGSFSMPLDELIGRILSFLRNGITHVGFVSPSHFIPQVKVIMAAVEASGLKPVWVYNTNGYDKPETLRSLEGKIDVYLPDFKYMENDLALECSAAENYPEYASLALREMYRQKGSVLHLDDNVMAVSGIIVRHLVLPGHVENSLKVVRFLAEEISPRIHVSLMAQYFPTARVKAHPLLSRGITEAEYNRVVSEMDHLGLHRGWIQEFESSEFYRPDFNKEHPFEL